MEARREERREWREGDKGGRVCSSLKPTTADKPLEIYANKCKMKCMNSVWKGTRKYPNNYRENLLI